MSRVLAIMLIDRHCYETFFVRFTCRILVLCRNRERLSQRQLKQAVVALLQKKKDIVSKIKNRRKFKYTPYTMLEVDCVGLTPRSEAYTNV